MSVVDTIYLIDWLTDRIDATIWSIYRSVVVEAQSEQLLLTWETGSTHSINENDVSLIGPRRWFNIVCQDYLVYYISLNHPSTIYGDSILRMPKPVYSVILAPSPISITAWQCQKRRVFGWCNGHWITSERNSHSLLEGFNHSQSAVQSYCSLFNWPFSSHRRIWCTS